MLEKLTSFITGIVVAIGSFFTPVHVDETPIAPAPVQEESFGAFSPVAGGTYRLKTSIGTTDTTIILSSFTEPITGNPLTMTSLATDIGYATIDPQSSTRKEFVSFTGITQNGDGSATLTGVSRGLGFQSPFTASSTLRKSHPGQSIFILSDSPQLFSEYARRRSNETITGQWTFTTFPITPSTTPATATTTGGVELATGGEAASSTLEGDIAGYKLALHTGISTSSAPASGNVVVVTGDDGKIDSGFLKGAVMNASTTVIGATSTNITGTYTKPDNLIYLEVEVLGGGGGGGGSHSGDQGGGGGAGGWAKSLIKATEITSSISYQVGKYGDPSSNCTNLAGTGGTTYFGGFASSTGGGGGSNTGNPNDGGVGGTGFGQITRTGDSGTGSITDTTPTTIPKLTGVGASSKYGLGGIASTLVADVNGNSATGYGAGGGGAFDANATCSSGSTGGSGSGGLLIITEYF